MPLIIIIIIKIIIIIIIITKDLEKHFRIKSSDIKT